MNRRLALLTATAVACVAGVCGITWYRSRPARLLEKLGIHGPLDGAGWLCRTFPSRDGICRRHERLPSGSESELVSLRRGRVDMLARHWLVDSAEAWRIVDSVRAIMRTRGAAEQPCLLEGTNALIAPDPAPEASHQRQGAIWKLRNLEVLLQVGRFPSRMRTRGPSLWSVALLGNPNGEGFCGAAQVTTRYHLLTWDEMVGAWRQHLSDLLGF